MDRRDLIVNWTTLNDSFLPNITDFAQFLVTEKNNSQLISILS